MRSQAFLGNVFQRRTCVPHLRIFSILVRDLTFELLHSLKMKLVLYRQLKGQKTQGLAFDRVQKYSAFFIRLYCFL